ncbi:MAG: hypothetical protein KGL92_14595 [Gammaproteobacteria bacterium]|nr:hypothetical protein [Gammaproteobacteria bacterium]
MKRRLRQPWSAAALALCTCAGTAAMAAPAAATGLKDPTSPPAVAAPAHVPKAHAPPPRVSAIFLSAQRRVAIIDGVAVAVGDRIGDLRILEITADGVHYSDHGHAAFAALRPPQP